MCRPSRMWMRSSALARRMARAPLHGRQAEPAPFARSCRSSVAWRGAPSMPSDGRLIGAVGFQAGVREQQATKSSWSWRDEAGSKTRRMSCSLPDSSRRRVRDGDRKAALRLAVRREYLLAGLFLGQRVGTGLDFRQHLGRRNARRQFLDRPVATGRARCPRSSSGRARAGCRGRCCRRWRFPRASEMICAPPG